MRTERGLTIQWLLLADPAAIGLFRGPDARPVQYPLVCGTRCGLFRAGLDARAIAAQGQAASRARHPLRGLAPPLRTTEPRPPRSALPRGRTTLDHVADPLHR